MLLAVGARMPFWHAPLSADEGGYAEVARLWQGGLSLYRDTWVDRPQGLLLVFRGVLHLGSSAGTMRVTAAVTAGALVLVVACVGIRLGGRIVGAGAAVLFATVGSSPFLESFTLSGELLAAVPAGLSVLAFALWTRSRRTAWLVAAGLASGCALTVKQSALDALVAALLWLVWRDRRRALRPALVLCLCAAAPLVACALLAPDLGSWWHAVVAYRGQGDSLLTGSFAHRLDLLWASLPAALKGLGVLVLLAAAGWRRAPLLARLWLAGALLGVLGGGNFHPHYYLQLVPPLAVLGGFGATRLLHSRALALAAAAALAATVAVTVPLWLDSPTAQARAIWPHDPHLQHDAAVADYVRARTRPGDRVLVLWGAADVYYLADRAPATPYLWERNVETIPGALDDVRAALAAGRPRLVVLAQPVAKVDATGATARLLRSRYHVVARADGVPILAP